ncbi:MAG TPA: DUF4920 domain-containing protein [Vicinamibacterales bacterium]|jgi:hypothetical protein
MRALFGAAVALCVAATMTVTAAEGTKYGAGVKLTTATPIETLLTNSKDHVGRTVRIDGVITAVCDKAGCWMDLRDEKADAKTGRTLRLKVKDGEIVFPVSAKGKRASAEGVFEPVSAEMAKEYAADAKEAKTGSEMKTAAPGFQIKTVGAVVY